MFFFVVVPIVAVAVANVWSCVCNDVISSFHAVGILGLRSSWLSGKSVRKSPITWLVIDMTSNSQTAARNSKNGPTSQVINEPSKWQLPYAALFLLRVLSLLLSFSLLLMTLVMFLLLLVLLLLSLVAAAGSAAAVVMVAVTCCCDMSTFAVSTMVTII